MIKQNKSEPGRPTKLTPQSEKLFLDSLQVGTTIETAATTAGLSSATIREWVQRGKGEHKTRNKTEWFAEFAAAIEKAKAQAEIARVARIEKAGCGGTIVYRKTITKPDGTVVTEEKYTHPEWTADAWYLERAHSDRWSLKHRLEHTGEGGKDIVIRVVYGDSNEISDKAKTTP